MKIRRVLSRSGWLLLQDVPKDAMIVANDLTIQGAEAALQAFNAVSEGVSTIKEARALFARLDSNAGGFDRMPAN
jgi:hypothetical protein